MFAIVHQMRTRIITSPSFTGERILGAILFENTMDREIAGQAHRGLSLDRQAGPAVSEGRQGSCRCPGRGPVDEAHARARAPAREGQGKAHLRGIRHLSRWCD
jgi:hypothetical protein